MKKKIQCFIDKSRGFFGGKQSKFECSKNTTWRKAASVYPYLKETQQEDEKVGNGTRQLAILHKTELSERKARRLCTRIRVVWCSMFFSHIDRFSCALTIHSLFSIEFCCCYTVLSCTVVVDVETEKILWWLGWMDHRMLYTPLHGFALRYFDDARHALTNNVHSFVIYYFLSI